MRKTGLLILGFSLFWQIHSAFALDQNQKKLHPLNLNLPAGVRINIFAGNVPRARHMAFDDQGVLFLSQAKAGKVVALPDNDKNGEADQTIPILEDRGMPHGLAFAKLDEGYYLYIAEETQVIRMKRLQKPF